jgi:rRNA processing protein Gar1
MYIVFLVLVISTLDTGEVISIVGDQVVVKATAKPPAIGSVVFNERGGKVGCVADIIGPVENPFFIIKPNPNVTLKPKDRIRSN